MLIATCLLPSAADGVQVHAARSLVLRLAPVGTGALRFAMPSMPCIASIGAQQASRILTMFGAGNQASMRVPTGKRNCVHS
jgi:hypothetical protein